MKNELELEKISDQELKKILARRLSEIYQEQLRNQRNVPSWVNNALRGSLDLTNDRLLNRLFSRLPAQQKLLMIQLIQNYLKNLNQQNNLNSQYPVNNNQNANNPVNNALQLELANQALNNMNFQNQQAQAIQTQNLQNQNLEQTNNAEQVNQESVINEQTNQTDLSQNNSFNDSVSPNPKKIQLEEQDLKDIEEMRKPIKEEEHEKLFEQAIKGVHQGGEGGKLLFKKAAAGIFESEENKDFSSEAKSSLTPKFERY